MSLSFRRYVVCVRFFSFRIFTERQWKTRFFDFKKVDSFLVKNVLTLHQILDKECHYYVSFWRRSFCLSLIRKLECSLRRDEQILLDFTSKFIDHDKSIRVSRKLLIKLLTRFQRRSSLTLVFSNSSHDDARCSFCAKSWNSTSEKNRTRRTTFEQFELNLLESSRQWKR